MAESAIKDKGNDGFAAAIESILSNPSMMSMISSVADGIRQGGAFTQEPQEPSGEEKPEAATESADGALAEKLPRAIEAISPLLSSNAAPRADDRRECLLRALKPYMSQGRGEAIDTVIRLSKISDVIKRFN